MPSKTTISARPGAKTSSSSKFANSASTSKQLSGSSVLKHTFAPSYLQLHLFASVVKSLDNQVLRLHDTLTGVQRAEHSLGDGRVSCLDWGYYGPTQNDNRPLKKRKAKDGSARFSQPQGNAVIAIGATNSSDIEIYSPTSAKVVGVIGGNHHSQGIRDFRFVRSNTSGNRAWSLGGDGKLVEWNMEDGSALRSMQLPPEAESSLKIFPLRSAVFCAYSSIAAIDPEQAQEPRTLQGFTSNVRSLSTQMSRKDASQPVSVIASAESSREILVFRFSDKRIKGQLLASNAVQSFSIAEDPESLTESPMLAAVTESGSVDIFENPFDFADLELRSGASMKAAKRVMIRHPIASIKLTRPGTPLTPLPIINVEIDENYLVLGWIEAAAYPCFESIRWRSEDGAIALSGETTIEKASSQSVMTKARMNGLDIGRNQVDDSHTVVSKGGESKEEDNEAMEVDQTPVIEVSSGEETDSSDEQDHASTSGHEEQRLVNGTHTGSGDTIDERSDNEMESINKKKAEEPSFGELLRSREPEAVDVAASFPAKAQEALVPQGTRSMDLPSGMSLSTVLTQSLRTNDRGLLETCFHAQDLRVVKNTIERLDSSLAGSLLERLAERLHNRPGRAGSLMIWIQWTLVAHGGYLASQPKVIKQLRQLHGVVRERAQALQPLLLLKGKLDMLDAQMQLRKKMMERSRLLQAAQEDEEEEAIYVEGQEEVNSDDEMDTTAMAVGKVSAVGQEDIDFDSDEDEAMAAAAIGDDDNEEGEEEENSDNSDGFIDDEAEEAEDDSEISGDDEVDYDDVDSFDEGSDRDLDEFPLKVEEKPKINGIVRGK